MKPLACICTCTLVTVHTFREYAEPAQATRANIAEEVLAASTRREERPLLSKTRIHCGGCGRSVEVAGTKPRSVHLAARKEWNHG